MPVIDSDAPELEPTDDLRASLTAEFDKADASAPDTETPDASSVRAEADEARATPSVDGRARGPDGKFTKSEAAPEAVAADPNSPSKDVPVKPSAEVASTPSSDAAPAGWTAEAKAEWNSLSPAVKAAAHKREAEIAAGGQQWSNEKRQYEAVLAPLAQAAQRNGVPAGEALNRLLSASDFLERDPAGAIKWLAQSHGVDLANLAGQPPADGASATPQTPDIRALVQRELQPLLAPIQQRWQSEEQRKSDEATQRVVAFASDPKHEHFKALESDIMAMIPLINEREPHLSFEQKLQSAYDMALYANPHTRASVLASQTAAAEEQRRADATKRANEARRAGSSLSPGAPSGSPGAQEYGSLREQIAAAWDG